MLTRIYIDNYACLSNFEWRPERVNLMLGPNGSGKSAVFDALAAVRDLIIGEQKIDDAFPTSTLAGWDKRNSQRIELSLNGNGGSYEYVLEVEHDLELSTARVKMESLTFDKEPLYIRDGTKASLYLDNRAAGQPFPVGARVSFLGFVEPARDNRRMTWFRTFVHGLWVVAPVPSLMDPETGAKDAQFLEVDLANFASWFRSLTQESPAAIARILQELPEFLPGFEELKLVDSGSNRRVLQFTFAASPGRDAAPYSLTFDQLSDGQRVLIALYTILHAVIGAEHVLFFDEPANYVSLDEIQPWLVKLADKVEDTKSQVFIISHNSETIDYLAPYSSFVFERQKGGPTRVRPFKMDLESGLRASEWIARGNLRTGWEMDAE